MFGKKRRGGHKNAMCKFVHEWMDCCKGVEKGERIMNMNMKHRIIILSAARYDFVDDRTGKNTRGCSVQYLMTDDLKGRSKDEVKGYRIAKATMHYSMFDDLGELPAIFEAEISTDVSSKGVVTVSLDNVAHVSALRVTPVSAPKGAAV